VIKPAELKKKWKAKGNQKPRGAVYVADGYNE
jgi:hypothetical protein